MTAPAAEHETAERMTTERAFESTVESMLVEGGWCRGDRSEWDVGRALFPARVVAFLREAQPELWERLEAQVGGEQLGEMIVERLVRELDAKGCLHVLRHGFRFYGHTFRMAHFRPAHGLNPDATALFGLNGLTVTRQVPCHVGGGGVVDMLFALNGVPVATCELKNPMTGQSWSDAVRQYRETRDPDAAGVPIRQTRSLVHFAADTERGTHKHPSRRVSGTRFLPFNRGSRPGAVRCGAGNPQHPSGYRSGYFWGEVLQRGPVPRHRRFVRVLGAPQREGLRRRWRRPHRAERDSDIPAVPSARYCDPAGGGRPRRRARSQLSGTALRGQRQDQQHLVAVAPSRQSCTPPKTPRCTTVYW